MSLYKNSLVYIYISKVARLLENLQEMQRIYCLHAFDVIHLIEKLILYQMLFYL